MKKVKNIIFGIFILLSGIITVYAKPTVNYEFGRYFDFGQYGSYILDTEIIENGYRILGRNNEYNEISIVIIDNNGEILSNETMNLDFYYDKYVLIDNLVILGYYNYVDGEESLLYDIYDENFEFIKTVESNALEISTNNQLKAENDKYFMIGLDVFDKKTDNIINYNEIIENNQYADELKAAYDADNEELYNEYLLKIYSEEFAGTYIALFANLLYSENANILNEFEVMDIYYNEEKIAISYYTEEDNAFGVIIFDSKGEILFNKIVSETTSPQVMLEKNEFYIVEYLVEEILEDGDYTKEVLGYFEITGYDYKGNEILSEKLSSAISEQTSNGDIYYHGRKLVEATLTDNGFYLITNCYRIERAYDPTITEEDTIAGYDPTFQKYYFTHQIETKTDGNGTIEVIESSKFGESVTFVVTPKEGYVLSEVKVTDANGNVVTFTDNMFTMPNTDVVIEAIFVKENKNPNTADIAVISCVAIIVLGGIGTIYSIRKLSWLK